MSHPMRLTRLCYSRSELDPKWNYLLPFELPLLDSAIKKLQSEEKELRILLKEAAEQSTENMGHDDATQESIRLTLWTLSSKLDYLRDAQIHHTLLKAPTGELKRITFGMVIGLKGDTYRTVALIGGADLPLVRQLPENIQAVTYRSPLGGALLGR